MTCYRIPVKQIKRMEISQFSFSVFVKILSTIFNVPLQENITEKAVVVNSFMTEAVIV